MADAFLMAVFGKVLVANRGASTARVLRTLKAMGMHCVAVWIHTMRHKMRARQLVARRGWPVGRRSGVLDDDADDVLKIAEEIGYPILVKPAAGGGDIGMLAARSPGESRSRAIL